MFKKPTRKNDRRAPKRQGEYEEKTIEVRRVNRVVKGGKRFSFRVLVVAGNKKGKVGIGMAKGLDVPSAIDKAKRQAEKKIFSVSLKDKRTLPHDVQGKYGASRVLLKPAREGHGLIAGGPVRIVLDLAGVRDVSAKILGKTTNKLTNTMAAIEALKKLSKKETFLIEADETADGNEAEEKDEEYPES